MILILLQIAVEHFTFYVFNILNFIYLLYLKAVCKQSNFTVK